MKLGRDNRPSEGCVAGRFRVSGLCFAPKCRPRLVSCDMLMTAEMC